jgi:hypothetical protein
VSVTNLSKTTPSYQLNEHSDLFLVSLSYQLSDLVEVAFLLSDENQFAISVDQFSLENLSIGLGILEK